MTKLINFVENINITVTYSEMLQDEQDVENEETDFRTKDLLSWQNILNNRQIAADIEEN